MRQICKALASWSCARISSDKRVGLRSCSSTGLDEGRFCLEEVVLLRYGLLFEGHGVFQVFLPEGFRSIFPDASRWNACSLQ